MLEKGRFITFEGSDGCGKSTQMRMLKEYLESRGIDVLTTREPGGTDVSEKLRQLILDKRTVMTPVTEALAYACARAQHVAEVIMPAVDSGSFVLCDRYVDSSYAYQGFARGLGFDFINELFLLSTNGYYPDLTFFLDVTPDRAFDRKGGKADSDRMEQQGNDFFNSVYEGYIFAINKFSTRIERIDARGSKQDTHGLILDILYKKQFIRQEDI